MLQKFTNKQLFALKKKFDKQPDYAHKIAFWEQNILPNDFETFVIVPDNTPEEKLRELERNPAYVLTIEPADANERVLYYQWKQKKIEAKNQELNLYKQQLKVINEKDSKAKGILPKSNLISRKIADAINEENAKEDRYINSVNYYNETVNLLSDNKTIIDFTNHEIHRTEKSINETYLPHLPIRKDANFIKEYESGVKYLNYLKKQQRALTGHDTNTLTGASKTKIKWFGNQKQLAELIIRLEQANWIAEINDGERAAICRTICELFDISGTKRKETSNEVNSFTEIMKPDYDSKKKKSFPKVFTSQYKTRFTAIKKR